jgi:hypothetical protein
MARDVFPDAVRGAAIDTRLSPSAFPRALPYSIDQIFARELPADALPDQGSKRKKPQ